MSSFLKSKDRLCLIVMTFPETDSDISTVHFFLNTQGKMFAEKCLELCTCV